MMTTPFDNTYAANFFTYFTVHLATSEQDKESVFRVRYRVYCKELRYEPEDQFPDGLEYDDFDARSLHCLISHRKTGLPAGCVRLIPTRGCNSSDPLPLEKYCLDGLSVETAAILDADRERACEISRLVVDPMFRRRRGETWSQYGAIGAFSLSDHEQRAVSLVAEACFLSAFALATISGRYNMVAMMEPMLPRLMRRSGIIFNQAGNEVDYHGLRTPYFSNAYLLTQTLKNELKPLYNGIVQRLEASDSSFMKCV